MEKTTSNIFSKMKLKELYNDSLIAANKEEKVTFSEMLRDWEYLSAKIPEEEFFKMDKKHLDRKLQKLLNEYKENVVSTPKSIVNQKIPNLNRSIPRKSCIATKSSLINSRNSLLMINTENSILPCIKKESMNGELKTNSILKKPSSFGSKIIEKNLFNSTSEMSKYIQTSELDTSPNDSSYNKNHKSELVDSIFNNIISPKASVQISNDVQLNNYSSEPSKIKRKEKKKKNFIVIKSHKYKLPDSVSPSKISPSFFNVLENDNYYKYIEKLYDTTQDINVIRGMNPYLKEVYNIKPPPKECLKTYEMLQNEFYGGSDTKYPIIINNVLNRKPVIEDSLKSKKDYKTRTKKEDEKKSPIRILSTEENKPIKESLNFNRSRNIGNLSTNVTGKYLHSMNSVFSNDNKGNTGNSKHIITKNLFNNDLEKSTHRKVISQCEALIQDARKEISTNVDCMARNVTMINNTFEKAFEKANIARSYAKREYQELKKAGLFNFSKQKKKKGIL